MILLMMLAYSTAIFQGAESQKSKCNNMYLAQKNPQKNIIDAVHLALA
jgi:hypothetical protein